jgi:hypothetical protein
MPIENALFESPDRSILVEKPGRSRPHRLAEALDVRGPAGNL